MVADMDINLFSFYQLGDTIIWIEQMWENAQVANFISLKSYIFS